METDLIPYQAFTHISAKSILILAPHADDEVFGCGGAILNFVKTQTPISVVILTDGGRYGDPIERMAESRAAAFILGYGEPEFWGLGDRTLHQEKNLVERFIEKILALNADLVFAPSPWEVHPDHRRTACAAADAVRRTGIRIAFYEVGNPLPPNFFLDITPYAEVKKKAMLCFNSQLQQQKYDRQISALNQYRTYTLPHDVIAAEAYLLLTADELIVNLPEILIKKPVSLGNSPSWNAATKISPLVSILILSKNSDYLSETIDSIALQTYKNIEIIIVSACPEHQLVPQYWGPFDLRFYSTDALLCRSQVANKAMLAARGEYFLFIDDGDWLLPKHIAQLVSILEQQPNSLAVYSNIALVGSQGEPLGEVVDFLSDGAPQLHSSINFIHSILFSQKILPFNCQFDEKLDSYEDLDFLIQVSLQTRFLNFPLASAIHRIRGYLNSHPNSEHNNPSIQIIYKKWEKAWRTGRGKQLTPKEWYFFDFEKKITEELEATIKNQNLIINQKTTEISNLLNSHSWKLTSPLRRLASIIKYHSWRI